MKPDRPSPAAPPAPSAAGGLRAAIRERARRALAAGALEPIPTEAHGVEEAGIPFTVRLALGREKKTPATRAQRRSGVNPFLPYDEDLFVAGLSASHLCLLNKFNVVDHHLLIVTRAFEPQEDALGLRDFAALWRVLGELDGLGFYNSSPTAGASQPHKHLQWVPALGEGRERAPLEKVLGQARFAGPGGQGIGSLPAFSFPHALARLEGGEGSAAVQAPARALAAYGELCAAVFPGGEVGPYNLLVTRDWMLIIPRRRQAAGMGEGHGMEINALGFAGSLFARRPEELEWVRRVGPLSLLQEVVV